MKAQRNLKIILIVAILVFISGIVGDNISELKICGLYTNCASDLIFSYGRPIINLFSVIVLFLTPLVLFGEKFIAYWLPRILWSVPLPIIFTFSTPIQCSGFLGCIPEREWVAWVSGLVWAVIIVFAMFVKYLKQRKSS